MKGRWGITVAEVVLILRHLARTEHRSVEVSCDLDIDLLELLHNFIIRFFQMKSTRSWLQTSLGFVCTFCHSAEWVMAGEIKGEIGRSIFTPFC